jgi:hypothetical protein
MLSQQRLVEPAHRVITRSRAKPADESVSWRISHVQPRDCFAPLAMTAENPGGCSGRFGARNNSESSNHLENRSGVRFLGRLRLRLGLVHRSVRVVRRRVDRVQLQLCRLRCVDHVVVSPRRHHDPIAVANQAFILLVEDESGLATLDAEELIDVGVNLVADLLARLGQEDSWRFYSRASASMGSSCAAFLAGR